jgi:5,10-methylenetetrahydrofolate reductase, prokaryotic form
LYSVIEELVKLNPHFISVTFGAGGSTRDMTIEIASKIKNHTGTEVLAHLTCVQATKDDTAGILDDFKKENIKNILALRGDPPKGENVFVKTEGGFGYANELVEFVKAYDDFSIGVAGYPECHIEAPNPDADITNLKRKVDAGGDFIITQLFFDNDDFYRFRDKAVSRKIAVPIIPGIFPIFNYAQISKIASLCGAKIPSRLHDKIYKVRERSEEVEKYGTEYAIRQSQDLLENDVSGLHFYSMNRSQHVMQIVRELSLNRKG